jgi:hypothetical protein
MFRDRLSSCLGIAVCAGLLFVAGCSKSSSNANTGTNPNLSVSNAAGSWLSDPCSLITQAEVETVLGKGATMKSFVQERTGIHMCEIGPAQATDSNKLKLYGRKTSDWEGIKKAFMSGTKSKIVPGVGDDAFYVEGILGVLARKGDTYVEVSPLIAFHSTVDEKTLRSIAERAVSRL